MTIILSYYLLGSTKADYLIDYNTFCMKDLVFTLLLLNLMLAYTVRITVV